MGAKITGWILSGLVIAFYLFDAIGKFFVPIQVKEGMERAGWPIDTAFTIGAILLVCTILYVIPRTSLIGAVLLTGYLGGAVATNLRLHNPLFLYTLFPVYFGILTWVGLWLREPRIRSAFPFLR